MGRGAPPPDASTVVSPRGVEFELVGRAGPIRLERAPAIMAEAAEQLLVVKEGSLFCCSRPDGDIKSAGASGEGLFQDDTRYLSELTLRVGGKAPVLLSSASGLAYEAFIDLTTPNIWRDGKLVVSQMSLNIRRTRLILDRLYELVQVRNYSTQTAETELTLDLGADFADMFEVRGMKQRRSRGNALAPRFVDDVLRFAYVGEDETFRETAVSFETAPYTVELSDARARAVWRIAVEPGDAVKVGLAFEPSLSGRRRRRRSIGSAERRLRDESRDWSAACTRITGLHPSFTRVVQACIRDLRALRTPIDDGGTLLVAGVPWYVAAFGRDSIIASYASLSVNPDLARDTLQFLARYQATEDDPLRDAEPGKIPHELRRGELARAGYVPHTPYYGTADATPLFILLAAGYHRWTADLETVRGLRRSLDAALGWINEHGDGDGDGFVEYLKRSPAGLENQGWRDSWDAVTNPDGTPVKGPIALVEVQAYVYLAKERIADTYEALGKAEDAQRLRTEAAELKVAFNDAFWMPEEGTYALGLDGDKRQIRTVTSSAGHALYCGIVDPDKAAMLARRLMAQDMFSGWGVRTVSSACAAFNPMSYHNGSVWPHDNAMIAAGLKRYGFDQAAEAIARAVFDAALQSPQLRLPELLCGFRRREEVPFVSYPVACSPQAWAAAAPLMLLQALLGISPAAPQRVLNIFRPHLPDWVGSVELRNLRVGKGRIGLAFTGQGEFTAYSLLEREGDIRVMIQE